MRLVKLDMTTSACPTQWEGEDEDGNFVYVRYRWGQLTVDVAPTRDECFDSHSDNERLSLTAGDGLDGVMDTDEMLRLTGMRLMEATP